MIAAIKSKLRSAVMGISMSIDNWNFETFTPKNVQGPIEWRDHVRWFLEGLTHRLFGWAYEGSNEEMQDGIDFAIDGVGIWIT